MHVVYMLTCRLTSVCGSGTAVTVQEYPESGISCDSTADLFADCTVGLVALNKGLSVLAWELHDRFPIRRLCLSDVRNVLHCARVIFNYSPFAETRESS
jgi:hypothetical protein